jgi:hypothetical protein
MGHGVGEIKINFKINFRRCFTWNSEPLPSFHTLVTKQTLSKYMYPHQSAGEFELQGLHLDCEGCDL